MSCPFTRYLWLYKGAKAPLQEHLRACEYCQVEFARGSADLRGAEKTKDCLPDEELLLLSAEEDLLGEARIQHFESCAYCRQRFLELTRLTVTVEQSESRLRAGGAYLLAKELSEWLSTGPYPREAARVNETFDSDYELVIAQLDTGPAGSKHQETEQRVPAGAMAFAGRGGMSMARKLNWICALVGHLLWRGGGGPSEAADELSAREPDLRAIGLSDALIRRVQEWLDQR